MTLVGDDSLQFLFFMQAIYAREYIIRAVHSLPNQQDLINRLFQNTASITNYFNKLYPDHQEDFERLFKNHIGLFTKVIAAIVTYDGENYDNYSYQWAKNGSLLAELLSEVNNRYSFHQFRDLWMIYLTKLDKEAREILKQQPALYTFGSTLISTRNISNYLSLIK